MVMHATPPETEPLALRPLPQDTRVAVIMGGSSPERAISLSSGHGVLQALQQQGIDAAPVDLSCVPPEVLRDQGFTCAFPVVHGVERFGEGGGIQALLFAYGLPFPGSDMLSAALAMDKIKSKWIWHALGLPTPDFRVAHTPEDAQEAAHSLGYPLVLKPSLGGSSLGVSHVSGPAQLPQAFATARQYAPVLVERCIQGEEFSVSVLGNRILPSVHIKNTDGWYDYAAKYQSNTTQYLCPSRLEPHQEQAVQHLAWQAFVSLGCQWWGRVDIMRDQDGQFWLLEVNVLPGMTPKSLLPRAAQHMGWSYADTVHLIAQGAWASVQHDHQVVV